MSTLKVDTITKADGTNSISQDAIITTSSPQLGRRNLIINGAMQVAQRGTSASVGAGSAGYYVHDRWAWYENGTTSYAMTMSQDTDAPDGFYKSLKLATTTAQASLSSDHLGRLRYSLEGQDMSAFAWGTSGAKQVTLSFWVKSNKTGDLVWYWNHYASTNQSTSKTFTINTADTWEYKTITFAASSSTPTVTNNNLGSYLEFIFAAGTNYTSGTANADWANSSNPNRAAGITINLADSTSNYLNITGVQLEVGSVATPFEHRSYGEELALCQRYFIRALENAVADYYCYPAKGQGASAVRMGFYLNCPMRATPSIVQNGDWRVFASNGYKGDSGNTATVNYYKTNGNLIALEVGGYTGLVDNYAYVVGARNMTSLDFDAEL